MIKLFGFILIFTLGHCKSTSSKDALDDGGHASSPDGAKPIRSRALTAVNTQLVTTTFANDVGIEGSVSASVLSEVLMSLEDLSRKEPENVAVSTMYLSLMRLSGQGAEDSSYRKKALAGGGQSPWFLIESAYTALRRQDYPLAEYLFSRADRLGKDAEVKNAANYGFGLRYLMENKVSLAVNEMQKAANASPPHFPALLTMGFLSLRYGDYEGAEKLFRSASAVNGNSTYARLGLGIALRVRGKTADAIQILQPLYKSHSRDRRFIWDYALALSDDPASHKEALDVLNKYSEASGSSPSLDGKASALLRQLSAPPPLPPPVMVQPADKPGDKTGDKPADKTADKPADKPGDVPPAADANKPVDKPVDTPADSSPPKDPDTPPPTDKDSGSKDAGVPVPEDEG